MAVVFRKSAGSEKAGRERGKIKADVLPLRDG